MPSNSLINEELERLVRDFTTVIPKEKSLVRAELLRFARAVIDEAMPEECAACGCTEDEGLGYHTKECAMEPYGFNACRTEIMDNVEKILGDNK